MEIVLSTSATISTLKFSQPKQEPVMKFVELVRVQNIISV